MIPPAPKGKNIWGLVTMNERGQLVIPKATREHFGIEAGQRFIVLSEDQEGIALVPAELFEEKMRALSGMAASLQEKIGGLCGSINFITKTRTLYREIPY